MLENIVITPQRQKKELIIFAICFVIGFILNVVSIIVFKTTWIEIFSQLGYVFAIAISLYILLLIVRVIIYMIKQLLHKKSNRETL